MELLSFLLLAAGCRRGLCQKGSFSCWRSKFQRTERAHPRKHEKPVSRRQHCSLAYHNWLTFPQITCKTFYTAIDSVVMVGMSAIPGLGAVGAAGVSIAAQAAEVMAWSFSDPDVALEHYSNWLQQPSLDGSQPTDGKDQSSAGLMDTVCGNKYTPADAEAIFHGFQLAADFAYAPKLFAGAAKSWPPPFPKGKGKLNDALDYIRELTNGSSIAPSGEHGPQVNGSLLSAGLVHRSGGPRHAGLSS
jgi:hypothetical protein